MPPVARSGTRLSLRELRQADIEPVLAIYGSPKATRHLSFEPRTRGQVEQLIARSISTATAEPREEYVVAVEETETGQVVGLGRIALDPHQQQAATFGFALNPGVWGRGYGVETVLLLLGFGFDVLGLHRMWGARSPLNTASARTMTAAGMTEEGTIRGHILKQGRWRDSVVHSMLENEWRAQPPSPTD